MSNEARDRTVRRALTMLIEQVDDPIERQRQHRDSPADWLGANIASNVAWCITEWLRRVSFDCRIRLLARSPYFRGAPTRPGMTRIVEPDWREALGGCFVRANRWSRP